jgi:hypothetical protein
LADPSRGAVTFKADATHLERLNTRTASFMGDVRVHENSFDCVNNKDGTVVCRNRAIEHPPGGGPTSTWLDTTYTGSPTPWITIKNAQTALPGASPEDDKGGDDKGGASRAWERGGLATVMIASLGVGVALVWAQ